jgi:hypothetical protein
LAAVSAYTVELPGDTGADPLAATLPIPGWIFTELTLDTLQLSVDEPPDEMLLGLAPNELITGIPVLDGGLLGVLGKLEPEIITCVVAVVLPEELEAVSVYNVLVEGTTALVPLTATFPIPLSRLTLVAPVTLHVRVAALPAEILAGSALKEFITGICPDGDEGVGVGVGVTGVVGLDGIYIHPHANIKIETITSNSFFIFEFLPFLDLFRTQARSP